MNDSGIVNSSIRFFALTILQIFLFKQISWGFGGRELMFVYIYPLFIMLLPLRMFRPLIIFAGFFIGLSVDLFYETLGVNAAAATLSAFLRPAVLQFVRPREGYNIKANPTVKDLGWDWFLRYAALFLLLHLFLFFSFQAFTPVYWLDILFKTGFSFVASYCTIILAVLIFNPKS